MRNEGLDTQGAISSGISRRRDVRVDAPCNMTIAVPAAKGPLALKDISVRGLCLVAQGPLAPKSVHRVSLTLGKRTFTQRARIAHCRPDSTGGWLMGMEFVGEPSLCHTFAIDELMDEILMGSITFY